MSLLWWKNRQAKNAELDAELRAHLEMATQDRIARGESPGDAARHAREEFGDFLAAREITRDVWAGNWIDNAAQDVRYAFRCLRRTPAFSLSASLTLAIGIGAVAAMFTIVHGVLLAPLPYPGADRLVDVSHGAQSSAARRIAQSPATYFTYKRLGRSIESIGLYRVGTGNIWVGETPAAPEQVTAAWLSESMLPTLQVSPILGRNFSADEDRANGPGVVIISEAMWRERFGAARDVLGKTLYVNSVKRQIIGVMPERFRFPAPATRIWMPTRLDANTRYAGDFGFTAVARLRQGVTPEDARRDLASVLPRIADSYPTLEAEGITTAAWLETTRPTVVVVPLRDTITHDIARTLWMLAAAAALVLLVACASVANLVLVRADQRQLELAVREALGAGRLRVIGQFFAESALLSVFAGTLGFVAAWLAVRALVGFGPTEIPRLTELEIGPASIAFTLLIALLAASFAAIVPALHAARATSLNSLREGGRTATGSKSRHRLRATIAALQIALALVALAGSGLLLRTFQQLRDVRPGFDATNVTTLWMQLPFARHHDSGVVRFYADLTARVAKLPGVAAVGLTSRVPLGTGSSHGSFKSGDARQASLQMYSIDDGYLRTMRIPLLAGRGFGRVDAQAARGSAGEQRVPEIIVSRRTAETLWGDASGRAALGKQLSLVAGGPWYTVIGVADDVRDADLSTPPEPTVYFPQLALPDTVLGRRPQRTMALVIRTTGESGTIATAATRVVHELDRTLPTFNVQSMSEVLRASTARLSLTLTLMSAAAAITVVLGAIGLYGLIAYVVTLRRREFGVRIALGAQPAQIGLMMLRQGLSLAICGIGAGVVVFALVARFLRSFLYGVAPSDPVAIVGAVVTLLAIAALASWVPARRSAMIDPAEALRAS